jgi:hypothetical protein
VKPPQWLLLAADLAAAVVLVLVIIDPTRVLQPVFVLLLLAVGCYIGWRFWASRR